eukprot:TRINITY_DN2658_c0_g3_i2.p2 TRINITY_DN2658_c0_g3~~TRINITY_DN2658_c0_g3_i2.p2  ORF type:complete len:601 (+),score=168.66 TRINITY_DN2658_c0_g3_i2:180-1805(+)
MGTLYRLLVEAANQKDLEISELQSQLENVNKRIHSFAVELENCQNELGISQEALKTLQSHHATLREDYGSLQIRQTHLEGEIEAGKSTCDELENKLEDSSRLLEERNLEISTLKDELLKSSQAKENLQGDVEQLSSTQNENGRLKEELFSLSKQLDEAIEANSHLERMMMDKEDQQCAEMIDLRNNNSHLTNLLEESKSMVQSLQNELYKVKTVGAPSNVMSPILSMLNDRLMRTQAETCTQFEGMSSKINNLKNLESSVRSEWNQFAASIGNQIENLSVAFSALTEANTVLKAEIQRSHAKISHLTTENKTLMQAVADQETRSVEVIEKHQSWKKSLCDTLSNYGYDNFDEDDEMQVDSLGYILDDLTADLNCAREETMSLQRSCTDLKTEVKRMKKELQVSKETCSTLVETNQELSEQVSSLENQLEAEKAKTGKLNEQNTALLGHQNPNQKIQYIKQLKDDVNSYKKRCREQDILIRKYKRHCGRTFDLDEEDLQNSLQDENFDPSPKRLSPKKASKTPKKTPKSTAKSKRYNLRNQQ